MHFDVILIIGRPNQPTLSTFMYNVSLDFRDDPLTSRDLLDA